MKRHEEFKSELVELLDSECDDYGLSYKILEETYGEYCSDSVNVEILRDGNPITEETFAWRECRTYNIFTGWVKDYGLHIEMGEDCWERTAYSDSSVKFFWMKVAPELWGNK